MENEELLENINDVERLKEMVRDREMRISDLVKIKIESEARFKMIEKLHDDLLDKLIGNQR